MTPEQFQAWFVELAPKIMELAMLSGFFGAVVVWLVWELFGLLFWLFEKRSWKRRAAAFKARQEQAKAAKAAQLRGGDAAGRACETGSGDAA